MSTLHAAQLQTFTLAGSGVILGETTITLSSFQSIDGVPLTIDDFGTIGYGTIEPNSGVYEEQISFTGVTQNSNGTATLTGIKNVLFLYPYTEVAGLAKTHSGGVKFVISNTAGFYSTFANKVDDNEFDGFNVFNQLIQIPTGLSSDISRAASIEYVNNTAIAGAPDASDIVKGITKLSVAALSPTSPIAVGDNDNRVPPIDTSSLTSGEIDALVGTQGTPGSGNKYVTNNDTVVAATANLLARRNTTGDVTVSTTPTAGTDAASKTYVDAATIIYKNGTTSKNASDSSVVQTIAHGLGRIPKFVEVNFIFGLTGSTQGLLTSNAVYNGTTQSSQSYYENGNVSYAFDNSFTLNATNNNGTQTGVVTFDATNIIITWTKAGSPSGTYTGVWKAQG